MTTEVAIPAPRREITQVVDAVPILDSARFEHMQRIANIMARSSMVPESLRTAGRGNDKEPLPIEQVMANCFLVVNQAARWGMDPFSVVSCCAVVHGRLAYEGKLVAAVIDAKLQIKLHHHFVGDPATDAFRIYLCDQPFTTDLIERLKPGLSVPGLRLWDGSVGEWKTTGNGTPWTVKNYRRMLIYRGTRDWTRIYESALMLGVYTDDELMDLVEDARARRSVPVTSLSDRLAAAPALGKPEGFSQAHVDSEIALHSEAQHGTRDNAPTSASTGDEPKASAEEPLSNGSGAVQDRCESTAPTLSSQESPQPTVHPETETPASDASPSSSDAGTNSELSEGTSRNASDDTGGGDAGEPSSPSTNEMPTLPEGWSITYAAALRRAQKKDSLSKYAAQYWSQYGGWDIHKNGPHAETAAAIFNAFNNNFGNKDAIEDQLRELL